MVVGLGLTVGDVDRVGSELTWGLKGTVDGEEGFSVFLLFGGEAAYEFKDKLNRLAREVVTALAGSDALDMEGENFVKLEEAVKDFIVATGAGHVDAAEAE